MPFNPAIPQPNDLLSNSQGDLLTNNISLDASFSVNHLPFSDLTVNNGKHTFVEMLQRPLKPVTAAAEGTIYTKDDPTPTSRTQLFYIGDAGGPGIEYQLTKCIDAQIAKFATNLAYPSGAVPAGATTVGGWTFLPGGLILQYGTVTSPGNASTTVNFPFAFPTTCFVMTISIKRTSGSNDNLFINTKTSTTFTYFASTTGGGFQSFDWVAIGK
jgi:hypothetical protein